jgi:hypothetical protein
MLIIPGAQAPIEAPSVKKDALEKYYHSFDRNRFYEPISETLPSEEIQKTAVSETLAPTEMIAEVPLEKEIITELSVSQAPPKKAGIFGLHQALLKLLSPIYRSEYKSKLIGDNP